MPTAIIYVFSGTDNTFLTAKLIKEGFDKQGVETTIYRVRVPFKDVPPPSGFDYACFGYPVHAYNSPKIFYDFVQSLPPAPGKKAFIFKTSGEPFWPNDASSYLLIKALSGKGFDVALEQHLLMPYNIVFRYNDSLVKQMYTYNESLCALLVKRILAGEREKITFKLRHKIISFVFRIQQPGAKLNGRFYGVNGKKCNLCMKCVKNCPAGNITFKDGGFFFDYKCAMCMRCAMFCPKDAINIGLLRFWKVNGAYDFEKLLNDGTVLCDFVNAGTKGYFKHFRKYYKKAGQMLEKYGISLKDNNIKEA